MNTNKGYCTQVSSSFLELFNLIIISLLNSSCFFKCLVTFVDVEAKYQMKLICSACVLVLWCNLCPFCVLLVFLCCGVTCVRSVFCCVLVLLCNLCPFCVLLVFLYCGVTCVSSVYCSCSVFWCNLCSFCVLRAFL